MGGYRLSSTKAKGPNLGAFLDEYRRQHGDDAADRLEIVLSGVVNWLLEKGHGTVSLDAKDHRISHKWRTRTINDSSTDGDPVAN